METLQAIKNRKSTRSFKPDPIFEDSMDKLLKAGMRAPVASGAYDSLHITVVQDAELLNQLGEKTTELVLQMIQKKMGKIAGKLAGKAAGKKLNKNFGAPVMVFVSSKPGAISGIEYANAATVLENMVLEATDLGIDSIIWGGAAAVAGTDEEMKKRLGIPAGMTPVLCASFGYAVNEQEPTEHVIEVNRV